MGVKIVANFKIKYQGKEYDLFQEEIHGSTRKHFGGQYMFHFTCPKCDGDGGLYPRTHSHTIVGDKITISPSIVCGHKGCTGHYWLRDGILTDS